MNCKEIFKKAHMAAARCVAFYRRRGESCDYRVTFAQALKNIYTEAKGERSVNRMLEAGVVHALREDFGVKRPVEDVPMRGKCFLKNFGGWELLQVKFKKDTCSFTYNEEVLEGFSESYPSIFEQIKSVLNSRISELSKFIF